MYDETSWHSMIGPNSRYPSGIFRSVSNDQPRARGHGIRLLEIADVEGDRDPVRRISVRLHPVRQIGRKHQEIPWFRVDHELAIEAGGAFDHVGVGVHSRIEELDRAAVSLRGHAGVIHAG